MSDYAMLDPLRGEVAPDDPSPAESALLPAVMRPCCRSGFVSPIWNARCGRLWWRHRASLDRTRGCATLNVFRGDLIEADRLAATLK